MHVSALLKPMKFLTPQKYTIMLHFLHIESIYSELRFSHSLLAVVLMIATTVQSLNCRLGCSQIKNATSFANISFSLVLKTIMR